MCDVAQPKVKLLLFGNVSMRVSKCIVLCSDYQDGNWAEFDLSAVFVVHPCVIEAFVHMLDLMLLGHVLC